MISKRATPALNDRGYSRLKASQRGQAGGEGGTHTTEKVAQQKTNTQIQKQKYKNTNTVSEGRRGWGGLTTQKRYHKYQTHKHNKNKHHSKGMTKAQIQLTQALPQNTKYR